MKITLTTFVLLIGLISASAQDLKVFTDKEIAIGAKRIDKYLPLLQGKNVALVANITSMINNTHLVDTLLQLKVNVKKIFSPEHGFRGLADAGEKVGNQKDSKTGLPIISLYGKHKKPTKEDLAGIDIVVYDMQDVGVRFYTYISTMSYCMEACAENNKPFVVLDRPNPNGYYIDGPVLDPKWKSFLGLHPVPLVYGMTCGEYAQMVNGEGWLAEGKKCNLTVIPLINYTHQVSYELPVKPSPNLPNMTAVYLYPSLGLFEGTIMSVGRGSDWPFQVVGHPALKNYKMTFTPKPTAGAKNPKYEGLECKGFDLRVFGDEVIKVSRQLYLFWLIETYAELKRPDFFDENFNYHAGNDLLQKQIKEGKTEEEIRKSWKADIDKFKLVRKKYLLYKDFE
ncbi:MAG: hypothetical protein K0S33_727 [Bacteroidetes bacterium]|jgi:uncharacterized protein YbbC (DUF1343 family)|nr:hypothetical protein [Bacteroidota bacterium]